MWLAVTYRCSERWETKDYMAANSVLVDAGKKGSSLGAYSVCLWVKPGLKIGTQSNGQGHETAYIQLVSQELDLPPEKIRVLQGDTDQIEHGSGTGGSRSIPVGGSALAHASRKMADNLKKFAAEKLETASRHIFIGQVAWLHARDDLIDTERFRVRLQNYFPVARFGASYYIRTRDRFSMDPEVAGAESNPIDELN